MPPISGTCQALAIVLYIAGLPSRLRRERAASGRRQSGATRVAHECRHRHITTATYRWPRREMAADDARLRPTILARWMMPILRQRHWPPHIALSGDDVVLARVSPRLHRCKSARLMKDARFGRAQYRAVVTSHAPAVPSRPWSHEYAATNASHASTLAHAARLSMTMIFDKRQSPRCRRPAAINDTRCASALDNFLAP